MKNNPLARLLSKPTAADQLRELGIRDDFVRAVEQTAFGRQTDRELGSLAALIDEDEVVIRLLEGRAAAHGVGLLLLTTRRLVFLPKGSGSPTIFSLDTVESATATRHRRMGRLMVRTETGDFVIDQILGVQAGWMSDDLTRPRSAAVADVGSDRDPLAELAELRALHASGLVDDTEYEIRKRAAFRRL